MHTGIFGPTQCGKTTLGFALAKSLRRSGAVLVCDPLSHSWPADWQTPDIARFLAIAKANRRCFLFIDEAGQAIARAKEYEWLFTTARHWGHRTIVMGHSGRQLTPIMRQQISTLFLFRSDPKVADLWAEEFVEPGLRDAPTLEQFEFLRAERFKGCRRMTLKRP